MKLSFNRIAEFSILSSTAFGALCLGGNQKIRFLKFFIFRAKFSTDFLRENLIFFHPKFLMTFLVISSIGGTYFCLKCNNSRISNRGPSIKYVTLEGMGFREGVTVCDRGRRVNSL